MPSLMDCVITDAKDMEDCLDAEVVLDPGDLLAAFDLDANAISSIDNSWESVEIVDRSQPHVDGIPDDIFTDDGPAVFEYDGYMIVRGREEAHSIFFVYQRTV